MSVTLPESVDAWRMVSAQRSFQGVLPISTFHRLGEVLAGTDGTAQFELDFGRDEFGTAYLDVRVQVPLTLICQRTLEPFVLPTTVESRLGLIKSENEESALPPGCEPLLVAEDGRLMLADVIEDELLLALPLVPINPDSRLPDEVVGPGPEEELPSEDRSDNPFAVLRELKKQ
ncbi:YceD family protein [Dyella silvatica]|uniref:YceD family protein n=1 Tax=Dyella silvatica TaxID=2992128 RepID=UPI00224DE812|nr:YceD family protein [Dyella silvatica]